MAQDQSRRVLWETPLRGVARTRKTTPEAWHAFCLSEERRSLEVAVRSLEFATGFDSGRSVGRVESVLASRLAEAQPGAAAVAPAVSEGTGLETVNG